MEDKRQEIELRSEEFNEVLSTVPAWIIRWGITMTACVVLMLLVGSAVFKYPDIISSTVTLTGTTPVSAVVARSSGKLQELYVENNQKVKANALLAVIENPAKTEDIIRLKELLQQAESNLDTIALVPSGQLQLGSLQSLYSSFYLSMSEYRQFRELAYHLKKVDLVKVRIVKNYRWHRRRLLISNTPETLCWESRGLFLKKPWRNLTAGICNPRFRQKTWTVLWRISRFNWHK